MTDFKKGYRTKLKKILTGFDPEGSGYDYGSAKKFNIKPDKSGPNFLPMALTRHGSQTKSQLQVVSRPHPPFLQKGVPLL